MTRAFQGFPRITVNPKVMGGKPCIRGMRVTVGMILDELSAGTTIDELLADYPHLEREDIFEALVSGRRSLAFARSSWQTRNEADRQLHSRCGEDWIAGSSQPMTTRGTRET